jgi:hypothetical protein
MPRRSRLLLAVFFVLVGRRYAAGLPILVSLASLH